MIAFRDQVIATRGASAPLGDSESLFDDHKHAERASPRSGAGRGDPLCRAGGRRPTTTNSTRCRRAGSLGSISGAIPTTSGTIAAPRRATRTRTRSRRSRRPGGCDFAADPRLPTARAKPLWSPRVALDVLTLAPLPAGLGASLPLSALPPADDEARAADGSHLLLGDGLAAQLWLLGPLSSGAAVGLLLPLDGDLPVRLAAALDLLRRIQGRSPERVRLTAQQRRRLVEGLRALDARMAGASYREIARAIFGEDAVVSGADWKVSHVRAATMRLVVDATALMRGGYRDLLRRGRPAR